jgi:hypothetical protein
MGEVVSEIIDQPNLTSHSFRIDSITHLWRDVKDIEFVRQAIGDVKVKFTSSYKFNIFLIKKDKSVYLKCPTKNV